MAQPKVPIRDDGSLGKAIRQNIEAIARLEDEFNRRRNAAERLADAIGAFSGSVSFVLFHIIFYGTWILVNLGYVPGLPVFDRYPFLLLSMVVSLEAIFLSTFVLMKQNREGRRAEQRSHLDLQINMLAERELTLVLQMLQRISTRLGVPLSSREIEDLSEETSVEALANELEQKLPTNRTVPDPRA